MADLPSLPLALQFIESIRMGGYTMIPLLGASVVLVTIVLERFLMLRRSRVLPPQLVRLVEQMDGPEAAQALRTEAARLDAPLARVLRAGIAHRRDSRANVVQAITMAGKEEARALERGLGLIDTIAVSAPPLGLLGTLFGLMQMFLAIQAQGQPSVIAAAPGIAKALITTMVGLIIAIPSLVFYNYFVRRVDGLVLSLEKCASLYVSKACPTAGEKQEEDAEWSFTEPHGTGR